MDSQTLVNGKYPTIYDYEDKARLSAMTVVDEIKVASKLVLDASVIPTNSGYRHEFARIIEKKYDAKTSAFDEGYQVSGGTRTELKSFGTMRVTDAKNFDQLTERGASDGGIGEKIARMRNVGDSIIMKKAESLLYGGLPASDGNVDTKEIPGLFAYINKISDYDAMYQKYEQGLCPFVDENCLAIDNQDGAETTDSSTVTDKQDENVWSSILCIAWGNGSPNGSEGGVATTFPQFIGPGSIIGKTGSVSGDPAESPLGGYALRYTPDQVLFYKDKYDGVDKFRYQDLVSGEAMFGIGIMNRFCLGGLRNIYLSHKKKDDIFDEMFRVEQNLIRIKNWFNLGKTGLTMSFYAPARLVEQLNTYKNNKVLKVDLGNKSNDGSERDVLTDSVYVSDGITVYSDFAFKTSEAFVS